VVRRRSVLDWRNAFVMAAVTVLDALTYAGVGARRRQDRSPSGGRPTTRLLVSDRFAADKWHVRNCQ
jgi:hypothetical protein